MSYPQLCRGYRGAGRVLELVINECGAVRKASEYIVASSKSIKSAARQLVDQLPDDATWDDLMYAISVRQSIEAGLEDCNADRVTSVADVRGEFGFEA